MLQKFLAKMRNEEGQTLVEYALIIVLVSVALIAALGLLKGGISDFIQNGVQIGRKSDHLPQFMNGHCFPQLYIFHPQTAYFHAAGK